MENKKLTVGIDINEVFRAKWLSFDSIFVDEFGEEGIPEQPYCYDFFKSYPWHDTDETNNVLKEPDQTPDDINPIDYQVNENGVAKVDELLFNSEKTHLTAKEVYNRFMYIDYPFEIFGKSSYMHKNLDLVVQKFYKKYSPTVDFILFSKENVLSIPYTLMFLSVMQSRFKNIRFIDEDKANDMWKDVDLLITTDPEILNEPTPKGKAVIKMKRPYNLECKADLEVFQIVDLMENEVFNGMINYKETEK